MRIDQSPVPQPPPETGRSGSPNPASVSTHASASSALGEDQAQFSDGRAQIQALVAQALQFPEIRQEKVNALRQVVLGGSYQPSPNQVAEEVFVHMLAAPAA